ncbi:MAG: peptidoglycan DD-metalloendopeptidase family protein [Defluviitaleaceae bacterium]|nr:peptidoglycan DD-metalloendopeptidase family protein [Defluviitaleaceae bacterium]MCL2835666.1 peptidoglycan DD-metalloendopeptidase family protein [Defluviitaleaceae bacterium]
MKNLNFKAFAAVICILVTLFVFQAAGQVTHANISQLRNERTRISNSVSQRRRQLSAIRAERNTLEFDILRLDIDIEVAHMTYEHYTELIEWALRELEIIEFELHLAVEDYERQHELFVDRVRDLNETDTFGLNYLQIFLDSASLTDAMNSAEIINSLAEYDKNLTDQLRAKHEYLAWKLDEVEAFREEYELLLIEQEESLIEYEERSAEKKAMLENLEEREAELNQLIASEERESAAIEAIIRQAEAEERARQAANNPYVGGEMLWPLPGISHTNISSRFGPRRHPITRRNHNHSGLDIWAARGTNIVAANDGKVIFAGWQGSYGNLVIIDHGGGMATAYAHCSSISAKVGDSVTRGQVIAKVGSTGSSTGNHLHFEVRVNGTAKDPEDYLK